MVTHLSSWTEGIIVAVQRYPRLIDLNPEIQYYIPLAANSSSFTGNPLYTDTRYNVKTRCNYNLTIMKSSFLTCHSAHLEFFITENPFSSRKHAYIILTP